MAPKPIQAWPLAAARLAACCALLWLPVIARGDETVEERVARLAAMSDEQKTDLLRKKERFDALSKEEQEKLRTLHASITLDAKAKELEETIKRFNQWLASLESPQRAALLSIQDPKERITSIKELMQKQEERRFKEFSSNLPEEDRKTIRKWLEEFVRGHEREIRELLPDHIKKRIDDAPDEMSRRNEFFNAWQMLPREVRPFPSPEELAKLVPSLSAEAQSRVALANGEVQSARLTELVRTVLFSRFFPHVSKEELHKYYTAMTVNDPRRQRLEGLEGDKLYDELRKMWNTERLQKRGGFVGQRGGPGGPRGEGPPRPGDGPPRPGDERGFRPEDRGNPRDGKGSFGGKRPEGKEFPPPAPRDDGAKPPPPEKTDNP